MFILFRCIALWKVLVGKPKVKRSEDDAFRIVDQPYLSADGMLGYDNDINPNDKTPSWPIGSQSTDDIWLEVKGCGSAKALCVQIQPLRHLNKNDKILFFD